MPAFYITIDGNPIATVSTEGNEVLSMSISGTRIEENTAHLNFSGGPQGTYLTWIPELPLKEGQVVLVKFLEHGESSCAGKTIDELFPDEEVDPNIDFTPTPEIFAELRSRQRFRNRYSFKLAATDIVVNDVTRPDDHGFGFHVLWNSFTPERARFSLHSYTLDELESKKPGNYYAEGRLSFGAVVEFVVSA